MADNKGVGDTESSANMDPAPQGEDSGDPPSKEADAVIVIEPATKDEEDGQSQENVSEAPTPTSAGGDGGGGSSAGGGGDGSTSSSPTGNANPETTEPAISGEVVGTSPAPITDMSPPPVAPTATPSAPINLLDTCYVCKQSLQNRDCEPKLLPCLHSFCLRCIPQPERQISVQVPGPHGQDTHIVNVMRCSVCLQDYKQSDIVDNYFVKDTSEASSGSDENSSQVCTSCEDNAGAVGFCVECGEWLCKTCIEAHQRVKFTKDHKIRKKEEVSSESVGPSGQRPVFCPVHKQEALKLFCETCDTLTCRDCQLLEHKEHRYQFLEEAFQNQKGIIETFMAKLQEKKNYVHFSASQVQSRIKEVNETHKKVEHEIKIAVFTLINEINKKGKSLLQQLESVTKERSMKLLSQQRDINILAQQILHVLSFTHWAISNGSSTALLYSKRLITYQLRYILKARLDPVPQANGAVRFFCDPTFWAKNVVNLAGNLVIEKMPPSVHPPNVMVGPISPGHGHGGKHPGQINLAQLRLQHMQQAAFAQKQQAQQQQAQQQQHAQQQAQQAQIQQQMRIASQMASQHPRQGGPQMVQQQPPRLISMQALQRGGVNGSSHMFPSHHLRMPPGQGRMQTAQPRHNGQQYPMMQPQLQRQHSNPGHAGPFPVASLHNVSAANPTSPTSASMASAHAHRGPASPIVSAIELIPSVTNPENLPCLPDIPPIQLEDAGSSTLDNLLSRYISASAHPHLNPITSMNPSPGPSTHSPGSSGLSNSHTPVRPSSTSSTGSRGSCGSAGRAGPTCTAVEQQVKVKQEPGVEEDCGFPGPTVKLERGKDGRRSACMMSSPESSVTPPLPVLGAVSSGSVQDVLKTLGEQVKSEPHDEVGACSRVGPQNSQPPAPPPPAPAKETAPETPAQALTNGDSAPGAARPPGGASSTHRSPRGGGGGGGGGAGAQGNSHGVAAGKDDDPNEDWCAVCQNGGELLCCDRCPKVFHITCHIPTLSCSPSGEWMCTFCRNLTKPEMEYDCDTMPESKKGKNDKGLSPEDLRRCERLLLYIFCHELSVEFQEPVPSSVPNYYKIIKRPMDLNLVKRKLGQCHAQHYQSPQEFVADVRLVFTNCAKYNEMSRIIQVYDEEKQINVQADSEVAEAGKAVSLYFEERLKELYPDQDFPPAPEAEGRDEVRPEGQAEGRAPEEEDDEVTEDSDDDFVQPRRKRLKTDDKRLHIK
ncbi:E3 ubiquitin-protein ligase TRIM33 isoform X1 [Anguilla anguilla]|uniref:E3 ubiquitin-protein ligase TRIM33 isoform X1 n=1 Tax=Anguilla anguilla TaxID=7936 RepID=UPI0015A941CA|nr:E3 ubiquitin-protein ligase TRIM33 isoform X1 [Anguilla anguilla]